MTDLHTMPDADLRANVQTALRFLTIEDPIRNLLAEAARRWLGGWRDIATAPKDGTRVMLWNANGWAFFGRLIGGCWTPDDTMNFFRNSVVTHWQPAPEGPGPGAST